MTKSQVRKKFKELQKENRKRELELLETAMRCGAIDLEGYEDSFRLPKIIMCAVCHNVAEGRLPHTMEGLEDVQVLKHCI